MNPEKLHPSTPVIIGVGQVNHRSDEPAEAIAEMVDALNAAIDDSGADGVAEQLSHIRVLKGIWPYKDPGRLIADRIDGIDGADGNLTTTMSPIGGNEVYDLSLIHI